jgi:hypothetical protein
MSRWSANARSGHSEIPPTRPTAAEVRKAGQCERACPSDLGFRSRIARSEQKFCVGEDVRDSRGSLPGISQVQPISSGRYDHAGWSVVSPSGTASLRRVQSRLCQYGRMKCSILHRQRSPPPFATFSQEFTISSGADGERLWAAGGRNDADLESHRWATRPNTHSGWHCRATEPHRVAKPRRAFAKTHQISASDA